MARNICPLYDFEQRREIMGRQSFSFLMTFQMIVIVIQLQLMNNTLDKAMILVTPLTLFSMFFGFIKATFQDTTPKDVRKHNIQLMVTLSFGTICFCIFMYLQKRVHKEVYLGIKNRLHQQNEFKTIFDTLDEAVVISS